MLFLYVLSGSLNARLKLGTPCRIVTRWSHLAHVKELNWL